ncbi:MAG: MXAN_5187 C-terminal domain-containing protein [Terriglobia bacterium]
MTIDEELNRLEDNLRRLKIEYETYFSGGSPRAPNDLVFRVEKTIKRFSVGASEATFRQRFRFNQLAQSYAVHNDLWRKRLKQKEEGLATQGRRSRPLGEGEEGFRVSWSDPEREKEKVDQLLQAVVRARVSAGETAEEINPQLFASFVREKTRQFQQSFGCELICFSVSIEEGRVKLRVERPSDAPE